MRERERRKQSDRERATEKRNTSDRERGSVGVRETAEERERESE